MAKRDVLPKEVFILLLVCGPLLSQSCFYNMIHNPVGMSEDDPPHLFGEPLFLTPIVESGDTERARHVSRVGQLPNSSIQVTSHSGYLTVNKTLESNLFFWFFPAMNGDTSAPVVVWLQGGPGLSSLIGVFVEHGPLVYDPNTEMVTQRERSWSDTLNVLYIDNPVGTGFSFTRSEDGYARNQSQIADELLEALNQFFTIFSQYKGNNLYLAGEGYACKYVVSLAKVLHDTDGGMQELELKGIAIGNGICDASMVINSTNFYYHTGLIDKKQAVEFRNQSSTVENFIRRKSYDEAVRILKTMFLDQTSQTSYFRTITGMENLYDIRQAKIPTELYLYSKYLANSAVRKALHVGMMQFNNHKKVCSYMTTDLAKSVTLHLGPLLDNYKVMFYHGHLDALIPYTSTSSFIRQLKWKRSAERAKRIIWTYHSQNNNKQFAGYVHHVGDFYQVMVWKAGHFASMYNPEAVHDMFQRFIWGKSFH